VIARVWRGWTRREDADTYVEYLQRMGAPASLGTPGNQGFYILHRPVDDREEFVTISLWDSLEVVKGFAGYGKRSRSGGMTSSRAEPSPSGTR
jgi:heme-degrading monooxygenase HmoA